MSSSISFRCPNCNARIKAPIQLLGQTRNCPRCAQEFVVRLQAPPSSGPRIVLEDRPYDYQRYR